MLNRGEEGREVVEQDDPVVAGEVGGGAGQEMPTEADADTDERAWVALRTAYRRFARGAPCTGLGAPPTPGA